MCFSENLSASALTECSMVKSSLAECTLPVSLSEDSLGINFQNLNDFKAEQLILHCQNLVRKFL